MRERSSRKCSDISSAYNVGLHVLEKIRQRSFISGLSYQVGVILPYSAHHNGQHIRMIRLLLLQTVEYRIKQLIN
jgi:hypothetical protein